MSQCMKGLASTLMSSLKKSDKLSQGGLTC